MDEKTNGKIYGVIALKGGVGKTTVVENLGATFAKDFQKKVLIVDANFSTPHLGLHIGIIDPTHTLHSVLNEEYPVYQAIYHHELGFHVIPGKLSSPPTNINILKQKIEPLRRIYDIILIDSSPSLDKEILAAMIASDELLVVSSPDYPTLSSTIHAVNVAKREDTPIRGIILNKVRSKRFEISSRDISKASEVKVLAKIPENVKVLSALSQMIPIVVRYPSHEVSKSYKELASLLLDIPAKKSRISRLKDKFQSKKKEVENYD
ncbi:MAG: AAA family ATPase [Nanoarchaeota archaeon]|nr:AAA family ATPase [Nanoarchaeota archaeon]